MPLKSLEDEIAWRRREIARSEEALAEIESGAFSGKPLPLVRAALQSALELHQKSLAELEIVRAE